MSQRISMRNAVGRVVPRLARATTTVTRVGSVVSVAADFTEAVINVGGSNVTAKVMKTFLIPGQQVVVLADRESWICLAATPLSFCQSGTFVVSIAAGNGTVVRTFGPFQANATVFVENGSPGAQPTMFVRGTEGPVPLAAGTSASHTISYNSGTAGNARFNWFAIGTT